MTRPPPRLYIDTDLAAGMSISVSGNPAHYLGQVLRLKAGDLVLLFNGRDGEWKGEITEGGRKACTIVPVEQTRPQDAAAPITLAFAPLKKTPMTFLIEKATELGVGRLQPVISQRTESARVNLERLQAGAREAAEQCERVTVPTVREPVALSAFLENWPNDQPLFMGDETGGGRAFANVLSETSADTAHGILIGPEGGFTPDELAMVAAMDFVRPIDLGPRILRAETAALAALTCWQALIGDWRRLNQ